MSSKLLKNEFNKEIIIKDKYAFIFNLQNKKKFKVIKEDNAINIRNGYMISFGGSFDLGNDLYITEYKDGGMNRKDFYGDKNYDTTNRQAIFFISEFKVYQIRFIIFKRLI